MKKTNIKNRIFSLFLALSLLGSLPAAADNLESPAPEDIFTLGEISESGHLTLTDEAAGSVSAAATGTDGVSGGAGSLYDPRTSGSLPSVRNQGTWNTCWAMAAIGAAELNGLSSHLLSTGADETDLSERHLIYFLSHQADDPLGNSSGDYNTNGSYWITKGGNPQLAMMTLASWHGAASESETNSSYSGLSASDSLSATFAYADELHLENAYALDLDTAEARGTLQNMILAYGGAVLCMYFDADYLFVGSPTAAEPDILTTPTDGAEVPSVPEEDAEPEPDTPVATDTPEGEVTDAPETTDAPDAEAPDSGDVSEPEETDAPAATVAPEPIADETETASEAPALDGAPTGTDGIAADRSADNFTACYYQNSVSATTNHEVIIVGWDDNYPAENFGHSSAGLTPSGDGAWLCRNSYGSDWGDGGYFWVSYYDASVCAGSGGSISSRVTVLDFADANHYDNNYEYDGAAILHYIRDTIDGRGVSTLNADSSTRRWYANIFTASAGESARDTELLRAVSTYTYRANVPYTVEIYTHLETADSPTSGTLAATISGTFTHAGYHTVELPEPLTLEQGEMFSVVFRVSMASDNSVFVPGCSTSSVWYSVNDSGAGQSFVSLDGNGWVDCQSLSGKPNVRIKAFTDTQDAVFPFSDVAESEWYYQDVKESWIKLLVNGMSDTTYEPLQYTLRAQVVTTLWRLAGEPEPAGNAGFSDVQSGQWYSDAIAWASENDIVNGYPSGKFYPFDSITRQELMTILFRYAQYAGLDISQTATLTEFQDVSSVDTWAKSAVVWSVGSGLQNGIPKRSGLYLDPRGYVTRAQLAAFLNRLSDMG